MTEFIGNLSLALIGNLSTVSKADKAMKGSGDIIQAEPLSWDRVFGILSEKLIEWFDGAVALLPNLLIAIVVLTVCYAIGAFTSKFANRIFNKALDSSAVANLFSAIIKLVIVAVGIFIALDLIGLQKAVLSLLAGAGIIGLALGFAFQDLAENLLAGLLLGIRKPCEPGDLIQSNNQMGFVQNLNLRNTIIKNFSGQIIYIPNKEIFKNVLENYSKSGSRRIDLTVGVSYGEDLEHVTKILEKAIQDLGFLREDKPLEVYALEFGDSSINFSVRYWIDYPDGQVDFFEAIDKGVKAVKAAFDKENILIPFPIRTLDFDAKGGIGLKRVLSQALPDESETK